MRRVYLGKDAPVRDKEHPPGVAGFSCPSEDAVLFGIVYYAEGRQNPTVVLCHGFPGMEKNYDLAHILRQSGFNVVIFSYRGSWGSRGAFSFSGVAIDTFNIVRQITQKKMPGASRFDPARVVLIGHSMGAFAVFRAAADLPKVKDVGLLSVWNIGSDARKSRIDPAVKVRVDTVLIGAGCLGGTSRASLWNEMLRKEDDFDLHRLVLPFESKRVLMVGAKEDVAVPVLEHQKPLSRALRQNGAFVTEKTLPGDHTFSSKRYAVAKILLNWLADGGY